MVSLFVAQALNLQTIINHEQEFVLVEYGSLKRTVLFTELRTGMFSVNFQNDDSIKSHASALVYNEIVEAARQLREQADELRRVESVANQKRQLEENFKRLEGSGVEIAWGKMFSAFVKSPVSPALQELDIMAFAVAHEVDHGRTLEVLHALIEPSSGQSMVQVTGNKAFITTLLYDALSDYFM